MTINVIQHDDRLRYDIYEFLRLFMMLQRSLCAVLLLIQHY
jgi:hypothetical protein